MIIHNCQDMKRAVDERRKVKGLLWKDLSEKSGVNKGTMINWDTQKGIRLDTILTVLDALDMELVARPTDSQAELVPREALLTGYGHGWEERWYIGDDEEPDPSTSLRMTDLFECVWINGAICMEGGNADADSDYWQEKYGKQYGIRVWRGENPPTDEQREGAPWT